MKLFLVALFLIITFVSQIWGKHYLVKTKDGKTKNGKSKGGKHLYSKCWKSSPDELFTNTCNAKELIYTVFKEDELKAFEKLPKKRRRQSSEILTISLKTLEMKQELEEEMWISTWTS